MNTDERRQFSERLAEAMQAAGYEARPSVLEKLFNSRYRGRSVTFTSVSRWLGGHAIPEQDKLQVIARLLNVEPHVLRFGTGTAGRVAEPKAGRFADARPQDREAIDAYLLLPPERRRLVRELIEALASSPPASGRR